MDIASNKNGTSIFLDIVRNAKNSDESSILSSSEISQIEQTVSNKRNIVGRPIKDIFGKIIQEKIDEALRSAYGKHMIHQAYVDEMSARANFVERFIGNLQEGPGKSFAKTDLGKMCIFDFHNQYGIEENGALHTFLNGGQYTLRSGKVVGPITKPDFNFEDFKRDFLFCLQYYSNNRRDVIRRVDNIEAIEREYFREKNNLDGVDNKAITCQCTELLNLYKELVTNPAAGMYLGIKINKLCKSISEAYHNPTGSSVVTYSKSVNDICKELCGIDATAPLPPEIKARL
jgi:hypothetical protein